jgi:hypothetical protein
VKRDAHDSAAEAEREENAEAGTLWKRTDLDYFCAGCGWETYGSIHTCRPPPQEGEA